MEKWKDIQGYEGRYQASDFGRIKSLKRKGRTQDRVIGSLANHGYLTAQLMRNGKREKTFQIHRLVAITFIPNPHNLPEINHKNGIKTDNRVCNLEWVSHYENIKHAERTGLIGIRPKGEEVKISKLKEVQVLEIRRKYNAGVPCAVLKMEYGVCSGTVHMIVKNKTWKHLKAA